MAATLEKKNDAEIGVATGTTVTSGNSSGGSGNDGFTSTAAGTGNTFTVSSVSPISGTYSYLVTVASTGNKAVGVWVLAAPRTDFTFDWQFKITAAAGTNHATLVRFFTDTGFSTTALTVYYRTDGKFYIYDNIDSVASAATAVAPAAGSYVGKLRCSAGTVQFDVYPLGSTTKTTSITMTGLSVLSVQSLAPIYIGGGPGQACTLTWATDMLRFGYGGYLPRTDVSATPPTGTVGADQYATVGDTVTLSGADADSDGTVTGRAWTWDTLPTGVTGPTITGATTSNASTTFAVQGYYKAKYVVTDDQGLDSTPAYMQIWVAPAAGDAVTVRSDTIGGWSTFGTGATSVARVNDVDITTGITSPNDPTSAAYICQMNPYGPGQITLVITGNSVAGNISRTVKWYKADGTTLVDTQTGAAPTSAGDQVFTMSGGGLAAIPAAADRAALYVHVESTKV